MNVLNLHLLFINFETMELYNFFTEVVSEKEKIEELEYCMIELKCICHALQLVEFKIKGELKGCSIIGQIYGDDTNVGDIDLLRIFGESDIRYTYFNAFSPTDNNIKEWIETEK